MKERGRVRSPQANQTLVKNLTVKYLFLTTDSSKQYKKVYLNQDVILYIDVLHKYEIIIKSVPEIYIKIHTYKFWWSANNLNALPI